MAVGWFMIGTAHLRSLSATFPALSSLDAHQLHVAADELSPAEALQRVEHVQIRGRHGVLIATTKRLLAVYSRRTLFARRPTVETFDYAQVQRAQQRHNQVCLYAPTRGSNRASEHNRFILRTPDMAAGFMACMRRNQSPD